MPLATPLCRLILVVTGISLLATGCAHSVPNTPPRPSTPIRPGPAGPIAPQAPAAPQAPVAPVAPIRPAASLSPSPANPATTPATVSAFRCALDNRPGMLVIDLGDHLYAAWDTRQGILYKVWTGDVNLTGTVYDTRHGPRPSARGTVLLAALPTTRESETLSTRPAQLQPPTDLVQLAQPASRQWLGHRVEPTSIILLVRTNGADQSITLQRNPNPAQFPLTATIQ